jgi:magnesium-transporting ATPase (P-type)
MDLLAWIDFAFFNFTAAAGIAIDACLLVLLRFRHFSHLSDAAKWCLAVGATHVVFPLCGFVLSWRVIAFFPPLTGYVYLAGAALLTLLVILVMRDVIAESPSDESSRTFSLAVLAVSWDALLSGPGKVVLLARYPSALAWLSFLLVGVLVAAFVFAASLVSLRLHRWWRAHALPSSRRFAAFVLAAIIAELAVFNFFLVWSLTDALESFHQPLPFAARVVVWVLAMVPVALMLPRIAAVQQRRLVPVLALTPLDTSSTR